ncbi:MAG: GNAT family N-acetyltransferase [Clostridia bacterium]|nr:GNAT family N-acetyltransferase [Clostridia bacterium]
MIAQIRLRKIVTDSEIYNLYTMMNDKDQYLYSVRMQHNSEAAFAQWLHDRLNMDFHDFDLVYLESVECPVGFVYNYDFDLKNGHCKIVVYIKEEYRHTGIGAYSALAFVKNLFRDYPLRKIYSTVYSYNSQSIENHKRVGFDVEGVFKEYRFFKGTFYDMMYLSIKREVFLKRMEEWACL